MTYSLRTPLVGAQLLTETSATQKHELGTRVQGFDPTYGTGEFIYLKGVAATAVGDVVIYDEKANTTTRAVAGSRGPAAVAMSANVANQYGWYQIFGAAVVNVLAGFVADANCYLTATAGSIDDAVVVGDKIDGMRSKTAVAAGQATCQLAYPSANANG